MAALGALVVAGLASGAGAAQAAEVADAEALRADVSSDPWRRRVMAKFSGKKLRLVVQRRCG